MGRPSLVASFLRRFPDVKLDLDVNSSIVGLVEERIDVAIRVTRPDDSSLIARKIAPVPFVLVASPRYLEHHGTPGHPDDLIAHQCLADGKFRHRPRWPFKIDGRAFRVNVDGPVRANDSLMIVDLALEGIGIALVPRPLAQPHLLSGALIEVLAGTVDLCWSAYAVTSQKKLQPRRVLAFIEHLRRFLPGALNRDDVEAAEARVTSPRRATSTRR